MNMKAVVVSKEIIKPSSPTPHHLRTFKLSLLDQLIPAPYAPLVLFYPNYDGVSNLEVIQERVQLLKQSLSKTLTLFYPLSGTIKDDLFIDCNDEGAYFAVSNVNCHLSEFLNQPDIRLIHEFLPCEPCFKGSTAGTRVTNIQANVFECGGIAIGICISHKILDGAALSTFFKAWAAAAAGLTVAIYPDFLASSLFPTNDLWLRDSSMVMWGSLFRKGNCVTRRFVFGASAIATLKGKANGSTVRYPTRVEVVSAFLWKCARAASEQKHGIERPSLMTHVVNLRRRSTPTWTDSSLGNLIWIASAKCTGKQKVGLHGLVERVQEAISKINGDFVKKLRSDEGPPVMSKSLKEIGDFGSNDGVDYFGFTSWCKFGFYETDFGWGKPIWVSSVCSGGLVFLNLIVLMETRFDDGIEAWVTLDEEEMDLLERDPELLTFASLDPSPLKVNGAAKNSPGLII